MVCSERPPQSWCHSFRVEEHHACRVLKPLSIGLFPEQVLPEAPAELVSELSRRYILLFETITGQRFQPAPVGEDPAARMERNVTAALAEL